MLVQCVLVQVLVWRLIHGDTRMSNTGVDRDGETPFGFELLMEKVDALEQRVESSELTVEQKLNSLTTQVQSLVKVIDRLTWLTSAAGESVNNVNYRVNLVRYNMSDMMMDIRALVTNQKELATKEQLSAVCRQERCTGFKKSSPYRSCRDLPRALTSGVYSVQPEPNFSSPFEMLCDQSYDRGGWTVIQNRFNGSLNFYRDWQSYRRGFGDLNGEFWLGLENIRLITNSGIHELAVLLEDFDGNSTYARFDQFEVGGEQQLYALTKLGTYTGTAGNGMDGLHNVKFTSLDSDNDSYEKNCAVEFTGAWWYTGCHSSNLNGQYLIGNTSQYAKGMVWEPFRGYYYSLKSSRMMVRRVQ